MKAKMITVRLPDDLHAKLKAVANREQRSVNGQIISILMHAIPPSPEGDSPLA
jgi:predicted HicB family RNase H-like nuclease